MKNTQANPTKRLFTLGLSHDPGFTLVTTLLLVVPLAILAVGMLTLSSIALRSASTAQSGPTEIAQANARLALDLAIAELQRSAGPDTRVTARADILDENNPPVLGVWKSWEGSDHQRSGTFAGRPTSPGDNYRSVKQSRFLAWLTSSIQNDPATLPDTGPGPDKVTLLGSGSLATGQESMQIHLSPTLIESNGQPGAVAWWVGGENQKARLTQPYKASPDRAARWTALAKSHSVPDPEPFGLEAVMLDPSLTSKAVTLQQTDLITSSQRIKPSRQYFHDLSTASVGLLTNTATGGWRKDLSLLSESWTRQPTSGLPFFRVRADPAVDTSACFARTDKTRIGSLFYPWSFYTSDWYRPPVVSWDNLMDFVTFYKRSNTENDNFVTTSLTGTRGAQAWSYVDSGEARYLHKVRLFPVIARIHWVFSHFALDAGYNPNNPSQRLYTPKLLMTPVITMWNPYDLELTVPHSLYFDFRVIPVALSYQVGSVANSSYNCVLNINSFNAPINNLPSLLSPNAGSGMYNTCGIPSGMVLKPGETRVYSPAANDRKIPNGDGGPWGASHTLVLAPGYRGSGGHLYPVVNQNGVVTAKPAATTLRAYVSFDTEYSMYWGTNGVGTYFEVRTKEDDRYLEWIRTGYSGTIARTLHPRITGGNAPAIQDLSQIATTPVPFLSTIFGPRLATQVDDRINPQYSTKGFVQSTPFAHFPPYTYRKPNLAADPYYQYAGTGHPLNYGFEYSYIAHSSGFDSNLPNSNPTNNRGYIISGIKSGNGLSRCVVAELPSRPLLSLGELNNWDLKFENPCPPFAFNLIGNSDATPLLPANAVVNSNDSTRSDNLRHDDSYCANHLLFDDWFLSSIAPDPSNFGTTGRSQKSTYTDFVTGLAPLPNRAYQPLAADHALASSGSADSLYDQLIAPIDSWKSIASRLEVDGMFNVNSTSVTAWRALLGHARGLRVPYIRETANSWYVGLLDGDNAVSRFSIAGDAKAGTNVAGWFPGATEFSGYRTLDDAFLDALATEVVRQVRLRGPFLSLSEFVNRQLSSGDLALAGALQAALNELSKTPSTDLYSTLKALSSVSVANPPEGVSAEDKIGYTFPEAAVGHNSYGVPGWTRQADILRPLAPILSARDDTFTIRAYGDVRDAAGKIVARAVCEAIVRRTRDFVDTSDPAEISPPTIDTNKTFGRRFQIISFRWLGERDV